MKLIDVDSKATLEDFLTLKKDWTCTVSTSSNNKTLNARLLARVITGCHYT
jgi:hypothetical protein